MKHVLNLTALLWSIILMTTSCTTPEQGRLRESVRAFAKECPVHVSDGITIDTITYDHDVVTYYTTVNSPMMPMPVLIQQSAQIKPMLLQMIHSSDDPKVIEQAALCRDAGASLRYVVSDGTDSLSVDITPDEL